MDLVVHLGKFPPVEPQAHGALATCALGLRQQAGADPEQHGLSRRRLLVHRDSGVGGQLSHGCRLPDAPPWSRRPAPGPFAKQRGPAGPTRVPVRHARPTVWPAAPPSPAFLPPSLTTNTP